MSPRRLLLPLIFALGLGASPRTQAIPPAAPSLVAPDLPIFEFHSGFWMNLHHALFEQARRRAGLPGPPVHLPGPDPAALPQPAKRAWDQAVDYYAKNLADRDLLFDAELAFTKRVLADHEEDRKLHLSGLPTELEVVLNAVAPVYRAIAWGREDQANREWVARESADIRRFGPVLAKVLGMAFQSDWPLQRIRVDLCASANWAGAYTTTLPTHVVLGTSDPRNQGDQGLEILFHESAHGLTSGLQASLAREAKALGKPAPPNLWHAVLFDTAGWCVSRLLPDHKPYAEVQGLWTRAWPSYHGPIERRWHPWLEGKATYAEAVKALVKDVCGDAPDRETAGKHPSLPN